MPRRGPRRLKPVRPARIALVGCGRMGRLHLAAAEAVTEVRIVAVVDPAVDARPYPAAGFEAVLAAAEVDAVLVAAPTCFHEALVRAALDAGKHVLCEKPLTLDPHADLALGELAAARGLVLQIGFWRRFAEPFLRLRSVLDEGRLGRLKALRAAQWDAAPPPPSFCDPAASGGLEIDCGVHEFDLARWLTGAEIEAVAACAPWPAPALEGMGDIDTAQGLARLGGGRVMTLDLTRLAGHQDSIRTEVLAEGGSAVVEFTDAGVLTIRQGERLEVSPLAPDPIGRALRAQLRSFGAAVRERRAAPGAAEAADAAAALRAACAMRDARRAGGWRAP